MEAEKFAAYTIIEVIERGIKVCRDIYNNIKENQRYIKVAKEALCINFNQYNIAHIATHEDYLIREGIHPADRVAMGALAYHDLRRARKNRSLDLVEEITTPLNFGENLYMIGSAVSNRLTKQMFDYVRTGGDFLEYKGRFVDFPIRMILDEKSIQKTINIPRDKGIHVINENNDIPKGRHWGIHVSGYGNEPAKTLFPSSNTKTGFLTGDYLTITRIPNFIDGAALSYNKAVIIVNGMQAEGTVAIGKLLENNKLLAKVGKMLCEKNVHKKLENQEKFGLQMLFKVDIKHNKSDISATRVTSNVTDIVGEPIIFCDSAYKWEQALRGYTNIYGKEAM